MTRVCHLLLCVALAVGLGGCLSLDHATSKVTGVEHVVVSDYGWRLFNIIPLVCGNATDPLVEVPHGPWAFFRDDVTMDKVQSRLVNYAATKSEKKLIDITYNAYDTLFFSIPGLQIPVPIPYLLCYREIQISGTLK